jgi:hypothetical protein
VSPEELRRRASGAAAEASGSHEASGTGGASSAGQACDGASTGETAEPAPPPPPAPPPTTRSGRAVRTPGHLKWVFETPLDDGGPPPPEPETRATKRAALQPLEMDSWRPRPPPPAPAAAMTRRSAPKAPPKPAVPFAGTRLPETLLWDGWVISADDVREMAKRGEYLVEDVVSRRYRGNTVQYLVQWLGFGDAERTWEPAKALLAAKESRAHIAARIERLDAVLDSLAALKHGGPGGAGG